MAITKECLSQNLAILASACSPYIYTSIKSEFEFGHQNNKTPLDQRKNLGITEHVLNQQLNHLDSLTAMPYDNIAIDCDGRHFQPTDLIGYIFIHQARKI
ncbi:hypothetical protein [Chromobacterium alticapitis]|uniref:hypothetical protein n=1 Tax=Chromobacterium alticapitis TaxID=2073169 RepID=UPI0011B0A02A|nr:hypothetical protein [Chromobacterium alticapitis]